MGSEALDRLEDFEFLKTIGRGYYSRLLLAETKTSKEVYVIKVKVKDHLIQFNEEQEAKNEEMILRRLQIHKHPFFVDVFSIFFTDTHVCFVMEFVSGGNLMWHLEQGERFGLARSRFVSPFPSRVSTQSLCKSKSVMALKINEGFSFYAAEVCIALAFLHEQKILYRDLRLENTLLTPDGHVKLVDFGFSKVEMGQNDRTTSFCGTQDFMAPEILIDKSYGLAVDWWWFGVLVYQMLLHESPFQGEDEDEIYDAILEEVKFPSDVDHHAENMLRALLRRTPEERLGYHGHEGVKSHPFFQGIDWDALFKREVPPPFVPEVQGPRDVRNFGLEYTKMTPKLSPVQAALTEDAQEHFQDFALDDS